MAVTYGTYTITDEMDGSQFWTTATAPAKPNYTFTISNLVGDGNADIKVGDIILYSYYRYTVTSVGETTVLAGNIQNLRGGSGLNNATVVLYKRGSSTPALPTGDVTYTFSRGTVADNLNGWTQEIPSGTDPLYSIRAVASSTSSTDKIPNTEWQPQTPVIVMENGSDGDDGYNQATLYLYQRKSGTAPSKPSSEMTYDFTNGSLTTLPSGWYRYIPNGTDPCYVTTAIARSQNTSVAVPASAWTDVVKLVSDGISPDPLTIVSTKYQEGSSNTIAPTGTWHDDPVAVAEGNYLWTKVTYSDNSYSYSVAKQGVSGSSVTVTSTVYAYQLSTSGTSVPTGNWSDDPVAPTTTQYAWTRTTTTFSDGSTAVTYTVGGKTGADGYTVILTNESHTFAAGTSAAIGATATSNVVAYKGVTQVSCYVGSSASATSISTGITGLTCAISSNNSTSVKLTFTAATTLTTKSGTVTIPVHVDGKTFNKIFTFSLALTGQKGDSISITSTSIKYAKNTSGTTHPTTGWNTTIPTVGEGEYLWTQTIVNYSDNTSTESYSVSRNAVNGTNGTSPTVTTTVTEYVQSNSGTTTPTSGWNTTPPTATAGKYMWTKVTVTYSDGATAVSYTVSKNGTNGNNGVNNATVYLYKAGSSAPAVPTGDLTYTFSTKTISGSTLNNWQQTVPTPASGQVVYVIAATANSTETTDTISSSEWSAPLQLNGTNGTSISITSTSIKYATNSSGTSHPASSSSDWKTTIPTVAQGGYLWTQTIVNYSDNTSTESYSVSRNATNGTSPTATSTSIKYAQSTDGVNHPTSGWQDAPPTAEAGKYIWTETTITYSDSATSVSYNVSKNGTNGTNGDDGLNQATIFLYKRGASVTKPSTTVTYTFATGALSAEPNSWKRNIPATDGTPCWVTTAVAIGTGTTASLTSNSWSTPTKLVEDGKDGKSLTSVTEYYARNNSTTAPADSAFSTSVTSPTSTNKYVWNYEELSWNDNGTTSTTKTTKHIVAVYGDKGDTGNDGKSLTGITEYYAINNSTTAPADSEFSTTVKAPTSSNKYLWNYELLSWDDNGTTSTTTTAKHIAAVYGDKGDTGENGKMLYGTCPDTAIGTEAKVVTCAEATELYAGLAITIKFVKGNSASAPTLNVNGLGAKNIYFGGANASSSNLFIFAANSEIQFVYNGTAFVPIGYPCTYYGTCTIAAGTAAKTSTIAQAVICKGTVVNLQMTYANTVASPTLNVSSTGAKAIYANGARPTADSPYNWIASSTVSFTFDGQYWRLGDTSSLNKIDVVNSLAQSAKDTADSKVTTYYSASTSAPTNPSTGDLWIKTDDNNSLWRYDGSSWTPVDNSNIQLALTNAASAKSIADSKIITYAQDNQPNTGSEGDLWIDTNDNNKLYRYNETNSTWVEVAPEFLVGGRNLLRYDVKNYAISNNKIASNSNYRGMYCACEGGQTYTVSRKVVEGNRFQIATTEVEPAVGVACNMIFSSDNTALQHTFTTPASANYIFLYLSNQGDTINNGNIKVEKGNVATDWTPAPEDVDSAISEAQSTADAALSQSVWYATCNTGAAEVNKVGTISPTTTAFTLSEGVIVNVKFSTTNSGTVGSLTLNINNTGAKPIKYIYNGSYSNIPSAGYLKADQMYKFAYDGTYWIVELIYNTNTNTVGVYGGTGFIAGTNGIKQYSLIMEDGNGTWQSFTTTYGTGTSKPRNTVGFKPNKILYMSGKDNYAAGSACTTCYDGYSINLQYSTNCGTTLVIGKPVYLVGTINNNDGLFYLEPTWWTQTEPVIEDGCIYIYLGTAYNTSSIYFTPENPIYIFKYNKFMKLTEATEIEAATALESANGKNTSYYQAEEPTLGTYKDGDTWFKMGLANIDGTKTGSIVSVDGDVKINDFVVNIDAVQAGSGDPSPTNVRSISGWTGCNLNVSGKNLFNQENYTNLNTNYDYIDGSYKCKRIQLSPNTTYTISQRATTTSTVLVLLNNVSHVNGNGYFDLRTAGMTKTYTTDESGCLYIGAYGVNVDIYNRIVDCKVQIELGSTATDYEPYNGTTYPISWQSEAGTVYGGTVDLVSGVLTVERVKKTFTSESAFAASTNAVYAIAHDLIKVSNYTGKIICDKLKTYVRNGSSMPIFSITGYYDVYASYPNQNWLYFRVAETMSPQVMKDWLAEVGGIDVVYELATPQTYQLTSPQISLLANQVNNIWADTGDVTLTGSVETIDAAVEVYQYDEDDGWVLTPYGSGVFATIDAGKITTGTLSTILIKSNNNDYWNLSPIDVTDGNNVYKANTLQTNHLIAEDDVYVYGGAGSRVYIPVGDDDIIESESTDPSYIDIMNRGMEIKSTITDGEIERIFKTYYPSSGTVTLPSISSNSWVDKTFENVIHASTTSSEGSDNSEYQTLLCDVYDPNGDFVEQRNVGYYFGTGHKQVTNNVYDISGINIESYYKYQVDTETIDDSGGPYTGYKYVLVNPITNYYRSNSGLSPYGIAAFYTDGSIMRNFELDTERGLINFTGLNGTNNNVWSMQINGNDITPIAEAYPNATGHHGAPAIRVESGMATYMSLGVNASSKYLFVYGSDNKGSLNYIGRVALV